MSEETCANIKTIQANKIKALCETCRYGRGCGYQLASDLIRRLKTPGVRQEHLIVECHLYRKVRVVDGENGNEIETEYPEVGSLRPRLWDAQIADPCATCPSDVKGGCERHARIQDLASASFIAKTWVQAQVVCCNQSGRLYQISEPSRK